jgi:very-short-patch-repair endonuclease
MQNYNKLTDNDKKKIIHDLYIVQELSFADIAQSCNTYANKIRRDAQKFEIPIRDKSSAQKNALQKGKHKHPTKGQTRDATVKNKIGLSIMNRWQNLSKNELAQIKQKAKDNWSKLSEDDKANMKHSAQEAVRQSSKTGSKLEKYLFNKLLQNGWKVDFHKEQMLLNTKLQVDLFLPTINTAIEVDGPSHFEPVWGDESLKKNIKYDNKKTGLLLGKGLALIRIKQLKDFSPTRAELIYAKLDNIINNIKNSFPDPSKRSITIEDE